MKKPPIFCGLQAGKCTQKFSQILRAFATACNKSPESKHYLVFRIGKRSSAVLYYNPQNHNNPYAMIYDTETQKRVYNVEDERLSSLKKPGYEEWIISSIPTMSKFSEKMEELSGELWMQEDIARYADAVDRLSMLEQDDEFFEM